MAVLRVLALAAVALSGPALAQTGEPAPHSNTIVYKCVGANGTVIYSGNPCSSDPKKMEVLDTSSALLTGKGGSQDEIAAGVADSDCRENAYKTTHAASEARIAASNQHIDDYRKQREALQSQINYAGETGADPNAVAQVDQLEAAIAKESEFQQKETETVDQAYQRALADCDKAQQQREMAQAKNNAAPPAAGPVRAADIPPPPEAAPEPPPEPPPAASGGGEENGGGN